MIETYRRRAARPRGGEEAANGGGVDGEAGGKEESVRAAASQLIDASVKAVASQAFSRGGGPGLNAAGRMSPGLDAIDMQLSAGLASPYNSIQRWTWLNALRALTGAAGKRPPRRRANGRLGSEPPASPGDPAVASYRILQRLISGDGVRHHSMSDLDERDFSMVLNSFVNAGNMNMAHRIVALQERTQSHGGPPLSPVAYSILIKGYGRRRDAHNIEGVLRHARKNRVRPDTVMYNGLIDGYVNCDLIDEAYDTFATLVDGTGGRGGVDLRDGPRPNVRTYNTMLKGFARRGDLTTALELSDRMSKAGLWDDVTTNTLVNVAVKAEEFEVAEDILNNRTSFGQINGLRADPRHKGDGDGGRGQGQNQDQGQGGRRKHPNVEAYTELIDGYAKAGALDKALGALRLMRNRGVSPNEYTYTCVIGAMARAGKVAEAMKMLDFMSAPPSLSSSSSDDSRGFEDVSPTVITYNALITGMLTFDHSITSSRDGTNDNHNSGSSASSYAYASVLPAENDDDDGDIFVSEEQATYNARVVDSLGLLNRMIKDGVLPDPITVSAVVEGMGRCVPPRLREARTVLAKLERDGLVSGRNERAGTALIKASARTGDFDGAVAAYRAIDEPDLVAFNAFLDACTRTGRSDAAFEVFKKFVGRAAGTSTRAGGRRDVAAPESQSSSSSVATGGGGIKQKPDVVTFTVLISALLKMDTLPARKRVYRMYREMRMWGIRPDPGLVDVILDGMTRGGPLGLSRENVRFVALLLKDAEESDWSPGELEKRKRALRGILIYRAGEVGQGKGGDEDSVSGGGSGGSGWADVPPDDDDPLFAMKGWNKVDSGFRLWGSGMAGDQGDVNGDGGAEDERESVDEFLESHGWNDVDSGFRLF